ncbi:MAG: hypothetical protein HY716_05750 [Planctomycetes bacterium]|nr:hypothetical protein [Planctomycetota bacterium]
MPKRMFGTAGIRGITNREITPELALKIALVSGDWISERYRGRPSAAVGHDTRYGSELLARSAAAGLASAGVDVQFYGCVPTGVFALNLERTHQAGGILITGSHLPPDRNGVIFLIADGSYAPYSVSDDLERRYRELASRERLVRPEDLGRIEEAFHPYELYVSEMVKSVDTPALRRRGFRILVDPANGPASYVAKEFFQWLGCAVELIHYDPSPVPGRPSEPRAPNVGEACAAVVRHGCDLGLCTDVDADRALFIDHEGRPISEDTLGAIFAMAELGPGDTCVTPITSSGAIEIVCAQRGARLEYCGVGQPNTAQAIRDLGAAYAYEESGKYYFPRQRVWTDGLFAGAKLLEIMWRRELSLAELAAGVPRFHQIKKTVRVPEPLLETAVSEAAHALAGDRGRDVRLDGFKRIYADHAWLMIRASATEPLIRVYSDAPDLDRAEALAREGERALLEALRRIAP